MTPPSPQARDKLAFLLSLVPYLLDHEHVSVSDTAAHFDVDEERVRQAVRLIAVSGVPGETAQYQHGDLFDIDWDAFELRDEIMITHRVAIDDSPRFSAREAAALIAGLQYLSSLPENADRDVVGSLMTKLTRGASDQPIDVAVVRGAGDESLARIEAAVRDGRQLEFSYLNARGEREDRRVDPLRIESLDEVWYLRAWCHLRTAVRTFRLDRMSELVVTDEAVSHHASDVTLPETLFESSDSDITVVVDVSHDDLPLLEEYAVSTRTTGERAEATLRVAHLNGLIRLVAGLPGGARVLTPPEARAAVRDWAASGLSLYDGSSSDSTGR